MSSTKQKLRLAGAVAALGTLALAISCRGFFVNPTLTAINISPAAPYVPINQNQALSVYGTYNDGSTGQVTSGVTWSSSTPAVANFSSPTSNLLQGLTLGTTTITANAQAVSATATATVYLTGITKITVSPTSWGFSSAAGSTQNFQATASANGTSIDITTTGATYTITPTTSAITCAAADPYETCTATGGSTVTPATYTLTVGYPGTNVVGTVAINVSP